MKENEDAHQAPVHRASAFVLSVTAAFSTNWDAPRVRCRNLDARCGHFRDSTDFCKAPWRRIFDRNDDNRGSFGLCISGVGQGIRAKHPSEIICPPSSGLAAIVPHIKDAGGLKFSRSAPNKGSTQCRRELAARGGLA